MMGPQDRITPEGSDQLRARFRELEVATLALFFDAQLGQIVQQLLRAGRRLYLEYSMIDNSMRDHRLRYLAALRDAQGRVGPVEEAEDLLTALERVAAQGKVRCCASCGKSKPLNAFSFLEEDRERRNRCCLQCKAVRMRRYAADKRARRRAAAPTNGK